MANYKGNKLFQAYLTTIPETEAAALLDRYEKEPSLKEYVDLVSTFTDKEAKKAVEILKIAFPRVADMEKSGERSADNGKL